MKRSIIIIFVLTIAVTFVTCAQEGEIQQSESNVPPNTELEEKKHEKRDIYGGIGGYNTGYGYDGYYNPTSYSSRWNNPYRVFGLANSYGGYPGVGYGGYTGSAGYGGYTGAGYGGYTGGGYGGYGGYSSRYYGGSPYSRYNSLYNSPYNTYNTGSGGYYY